MKTLFSLLVIASCTVLFSCSNASDPENTAAKMSINELSTSPGYSWFQGEMALYQPDTAIVRQVKQAYDNTQHQFYVFVNPSCGCDGTRLIFPHTVRILKDAGVPDDHIEIYSMRTAQDKQPYSDHISISGLPTIVIARQGKTELQFSSVENGKKVEEVVLEGMKKP